MKHLQETWALLFVEDELLCIVAEPSQYAVCEMCEYLPGDDSGEQTAVAICNEHNNGIAALAEIVKLRKQMLHQNIWSECPECSCLFIPGGCENTEKCAGCYQQELTSLKAQIAKLL